MLASGPERSDGQKETSETGEGNKTGRNCRTAATDDGGGGGARASTRRMRSACQMLPVPQAETLCVGFCGVFFSLRGGSFRFSFAPFRNATGLAPSELAGQSAQQKKPHFFMGSVLERRPSAQNSWSGRNGRGENVEEPTRNTTSDTARVATLLACSEIGKLNTRHISAHVLIESRLEQHERRRK